MWKTFYYLIDLHYSQTADACYDCNYLFYYLIDLHYSQTDFYTVRYTAGFTTL